MFLLGLKYGGSPRPWKSFMVVDLLISSIGVFAIIFLIEACYAIYASMLEVQRLKKEGKVAKVKKVEQAGVK